MGTRHLIAVTRGDDFKVAQYGQWDGYPSGQGVSILKFLKDADMEAFGRAVDACSFATKDDLERIQREIDGGAPFPSHLSRDAGSDILDMVMEGPLLLKDSRQFGTDGLFCEYAYVVDLEDRTLEVYEGFKSEAKGRFADMPRAEDDSKEYSAVDLVKTYSLDDLPSEEQFLADLEQQDDED